MAPKTATIAWGIAEQIYVRSWKKSNAYLEDSRPRANHQRPGVEPADNLQGVSQMMPCSRERIIEEHSSRSGYSAPGNGHMAKQAQGYTGASRQ